MWKNNTEDVLSVRIKTTQSNIMCKAINKYAAHRRGNCLQSKCFKFGKVFLTFVQFLLSYLL